jgi:cell shape-determining protein MreD
MGTAQRRRIEEVIAREVLLLLALAALAAAQTAMLPRLFGMPANLLLTLTICQALLAGPANAARWAFYGGLALDLFAPSPLGAHALALLAAILAAALPFGRLSLTNWFVPLLAVLFGALAYVATLGALTSLLVAPLDWRTYLPIVGMPEVLIALVPALPLFLLMRLIRSRMRGEVPVDVY